MKQISQSELVIMNVLWVRAPQNKHGMGANEVAENVTSESWNIKTVKTLLSRLVQKDVLTTRKEGRRYLYSPLISKEDYGLRILDGVSQTFFKEDAAPLFLHLAKSKNLKTEDIDDIKALLEALKPAEGEGS